MVIIFGFHLSSLKQFPDFFSKKQLSFQTFPKLLYLHISFNYCCSKWVHLVMLTVIYKCHKKMWRKQIYLQICFCTANYVFYFFRIRKHFFKSIMEIIGHWSMNCTIYISYISPCPGGPNISSLFSIILQIIHAASILIPKAVSKALHSSLELYMTYITISSHPISV